MSTIKEFIEALKEERSYDWISRNGWGLTKDELIDIIKEYDFAIHSMKSYDSKEDVYDSIAEELTDRCLYEED